jgi:hypothetical protein
MPRKSGAGAALEKNCSYYRDKPAVLFWASKIPPEFSKIEIHESKIRTHC